MSASLPTFIHVAENGQIVFRAEMAADTFEMGRVPSRRGEDGWEGPVFLPGNRRFNRRPGNLFFARLHGYTQTYPFLPSKDSVTIRPSPDSEVFQALMDSHFVANEWAVREDATHPKSKTYKRTKP